MMSGQKINRRQSMHGQAFDRTFLQMMITHHHGALEMARTEQAAFPACLLPAHKSYWLLRYQAGVYFKTGVWA